MIFNTATTRAARNRMIPGALAFLLTLSGCGGPPTKTMAEAEGALADARLAEKCAPVEYAAARRMMDKANEQLAAEDYDAAEQSARAARKLAEKAQQKALARKDECDREQSGQENADAADVNEVIDPNEGTSMVEVSEGAGELQTIYFDYNAFDLTTEARRTLAENAAWLNSHADDSVTVEGHCDKRGSSEYNLALGERRAKVVVKYLNSLGVSSSRLQPTSLGEESLVDYGDTETAHARNRRVELHKR